VPLALGDSDDSRTKGTARLLAVVRTIAGNRPTIDAFLLKTCVAVRTGIASGKSAVPLRLYG
jgi:hypothetical protein